MQKHHFLKLKRRNLPQCVAKELPFPCFENNGASTNREKSKLGNVRIRRNFGARQIH
jgi:hypothetical protein